MSDITREAAKRVAAGAVGRVDGYVVEGGDPSGLMARGNHAFIAAPADSAALLLGTAALAASRGYAHDLETSSVEAVIEGASQSLRDYGFCVIDHVVPRAEVASVAHEISDGMDATLLTAINDTARHDVSIQPLYASYVAHPAVLGVAQEALESHVRIGQWGRRNIPSDDQMPPGVRNLPLITAKLPTTDPSLKKFTQAIRRSVLTSGSCLTDCLWLPGQGWVRSAGRSGGVSARVPHGLAPRYGEGELREYTPAVPGCLYGAEYGVVHH